MRRNVLLALILVTLVGSCRLFQRNRGWENGYPDSTVTVPDYGYEGEEWTAPNEILYKNYRGSHEKNWDLVHTSLSLNFKFAERVVWGQAEITLHPHWEKMDSLVLDAKNMEIKEIFAFDSQDTSKLSVPVFYSPKWNYKDSAHLIVYLNRKFERSEQLKLKISYSAFPYKQNSTGSDAISGDRGMYFINHDLSDPLKPRQIWTQGETESNCHWFPTIDAPNQKTTLKIALTVPDTMVTLSNGTLVKSTSIGTGLRMDEWEQKQPHAPYLTMIAVGNWAVINDKWRGKPVQYLVEKKYEKYASMIFGNTPKMIEFFSDYTGVDFPWDKYSQVVVRDFVSGAMENTTATVHMDELQHTPSEHIDNTYEDYISHELFHQWFGDLVTTESWSNITLNESFATYGEYLWREFYYGKANAHVLLRECRDQYRFGYGPQLHLVRYAYDNENELFDNVSYQKGACVLHMLRYYIGDAAFREGLKRYLTQYRFQSAEVANLRMVFEEVSGKDLNWFFNQWYFGAGHPRIQLGVQNSDGQYFLHVEQTQSERNSFSFPVKIQWSENGVVREKMEFVNSRVKAIPLGTTAPDWFVFDADNALLFDLRNPNFNTSDAENVKMLFRAFQGNENPETKARLLESALDIARNSMYFEEERDTVREAFLPFRNEALKEKDNVILHMLFSFLEDHSSFWKSDSAYVQDIAREIAGSIEAKSYTRIAALQLVDAIGIPDSFFIRLTSDSSAAVSAAAVKSLLVAKKFTELGKLRLQSESCSLVTIAWFRKLVFTEHIEFGEALHLISSNKNVDPAAFDGALSILFVHADSAQKNAALRFLTDTLKTEGKTLWLQIMASRLKMEIRQLEQLINDSSSESESEMREYSQSQIGTYRDFLKEIQP